MDLMVSGLLFMLVGSQMELFRRVGRLTQAVEMFEKRFASVEQHLNEVYFNRKGQQ